MTISNYKLASRQTKLSGGSGRLARFSLLLWVVLLLLVQGLTQISHSAETRLVSNVTYYHTNLQRTPIAGTDEAGQVLWSQGYSDYGYNDGTDGQAGSDGLSTRIGLGGHVEDQVDDLRLVYMGARYYDPRLGLFLSMDPLGFRESNPQSFNRYAYANNNPQKYIDPDGRDPDFVLALDPMLFMSDIAPGMYGVDTNTKEGTVEALKMMQQEAFYELGGAIIGAGIGKLAGKFAGKVPKGGFDSTGRVITKNGEAVTIRGKQVSPHAIEQAVKRGVPPKEIMKALDQGVPKAKQSLGEATVVRKGPKAIVTTKENDTIITTIIGKQRPQF